MKFPINYFWILTISILSLMLTNCSYGKYYYQHFNDELSITPEIGKVATASLGDPIITMGTGHFTKVLKVTANCSKSDNAGRILIISEGLYQMVHQDNFYEYFSPLDPSQTNWENKYGNRISQTWNPQIRVSSSGEIRVIRANGSIIAGNFKGVLEFEILDSVFIEKKIVFSKPCFI